MKYIFIITLFLYSCGPITYVVDGPPGKQGIVGPSGTNGVDGTNGIQGATGSAGNDGAMGPQGVQGVTGDTGSQGPQGTTGASGSNGVDAHPVISVKFCNDDTSGFPEYGLKIWNSSTSKYDVYAVYYAPPNAGLALITPGNYRSTLGNGCSFTLNNDGSIH